MRAILCITGVFGVLCAPCVARGQDANDPSRLGADIARSENQAGLLLERDAEDLAANTENAIDEEMRRDSARVRALDGSASSIAKIPAVPTLDDSDSSIERDIDSLESQERSLESIK